MFVGSILVCLGLPTVTADIERIRLKSGHSIRAEVLKEKEDALVVDLGIEVLVIPKKAIAERSEADNDGATLASGGRAYGESTNLYATADLPVATVKDLVERFGEAVVQVKTPSGSGSGFVIDEQGHCITNFHVIERETQVAVDLFLKSGGSIAERTVSDVKIVALSPFFDLALLKIPPTEGVKLKRAYLGFSDEVRPGDLAFAIGNPLGLTRSVSQGIISKRNRLVSGQIYIQMTTQINPGNSGGPLFNSRGQVIGVTNMGILMGEGLGFAIPVDYVKDFLRNRDAFAYRKDNPNTGYRYLKPPRRRIAKDD